MVIIIELRPKSFANFYPILGCLYYYLVVLNSITF